jgi:hypothetical protein
MLSISQSQMTSSKPAANKVLPKAGVTNFYETFVLYSTLVFQMNSSAEMPRLRQSENRWRLFQNKTKGCCQNHRSLEKDN